MWPARTSEPLGTSGAAVPLLLFVVASFVWVVRPLLFYYVFYVVFYYARLVRTAYARPVRAV